MSDSHQIKHLRRFAWILEQVMCGFCCVYHVQFNDDEKKTRLTTLSHAHSDNKEMTRFHLWDPKAGYFAFFQSYLVEMMLHTYFVSTLLFFVTLGKHYLHAHSMDTIIHRSCYLTNNNPLFFRSIRRTEECESRITESRICSNCRGKKCFDGM